MRDAIGIFKFAVTGEAVEDESESLIAFHIAGTFEEFVQDSADDVLR